MATPCRRARAEGRRAVERTCPPSSASCCNVVLIESWCHLHILEEVGVSGKDVCLVWGEYLSQTVGIENVVDGLHLVPCGCVLDDLMKYVEAGRNCRVMLIGDRAQLPPVGEDESPALMPQVMGSYGHIVMHATLSEVVRQEEDSGILWNATKVRQMADNEYAEELPKVCFRGFDDIRNVPGNELIEELASSYSRAGLDDTIVITRSNKLAIRYNNGIRNMVLGNEDELCSGDRLMIVKNNYYWTEKEKLPLPFIANGDRVKVERVRNIRELYGFRFADVTMSFRECSRGLRPEGRSVALRYA